LELNGVALGGLGCLGGEALSVCLDDLNAGFVEYLLLEGCE